MKKLSLLFIALLTVILISCDQQKVNVPEKVQASFDEMFPVASEVEWEMENENEWEAEFKMDGKDVSACFTVDGKWVETEYEIESLPETIETIINESYPGYEISKVEIVESPAFEGFEIELENEDGEIEIKVTTNGEILEVEVDENEGEEAEEG